MLGRLARDVPSLVAAPTTGAQAAQAVKRQIAARNDRFLAMLERSIFGHAQSPTGGCSETPAASPETYAPS
jgi:hypothetical protein